MALQKETRIESKKIREAAKGEACTLEIYGVCRSRSDTTVLCHLPDESHGMSRKSDDISSCFGCADCHDVIDGRRKWPDGEEKDKQWYFRRAQTRTLRRLIELDVISIKGMK